MLNNMLMLIFKCVKMMLARLKNAE